MKGSDIFGAFYKTLKRTREYHQRFPNLTAEHNLNEGVEINVPFSGEEVFGKYFDLHAFYMRYINLPKIQTGADTDYLHFLDKFNSFFHIPESHKDSKAYSDYLNDLWEYMETFFRRVQPLVDFTETVSEWQSDFNEKWTSGKIAGWKASSTKNSKGDAQNSLRLGMFNAPTELEALGMDRLKEALQAMGLKCGGTLKDRADRLWSVRGKKVEEIPAKLRAPGTKGDSSGDGDFDSKKKVFFISLYVDKKVNVTLFLDCFPRVQNPKHMRNHDGNCNSDATTCREATVAHSRRKGS